MSDKGLDDLDRIAAAYRKLPRPEPSPALDAAILAQARAALAKPVRRTRWPTWIASAAAVTLAVGLAWQVREQGDPGQPAPFAPPPAPASAPVEIEFSAAEEAPRQSAEAPPLGDARLNEGFADTAASAAKPAVTEEKRKFEQQVSGERSEQAEAGLAKQVPAGKDEADVAPRKSAEAAQPAPVLAPAPAPAAPPPPPRPADAVEELVLDEPAPPAPAEPFPQTAAEVPGRADTEAEAQVRPEAKKEDAFLRRRETAAGPETRDADRAKLSSDDATATTAPLGAIAGASSRTGGKAVADELERIRELLRDGRRDEAVRAFAEFRKRYPDATVPDDLRELED